MGPAQQEHRLDKLHLLQPAEVCELHQRCYQRYSSTIGRHLFDSVAEPYSVGYVAGRKGRGMQNVRHLLLHFYSKQYGT